jgi:hypothetical protein
MKNQTRALAGHGVSLHLTDGNGTASFFYAYTNPDENAFISALLLRDVAIWLAESGNLSNSDGGQMVLADTVLFPDGCEFLDSSVRFKATK